MGIKFSLEIERKLMCEIVTVVRLGRKLQIRVLTTQKGICFGTRSAVDYIFNTIQ